MNRPTFSIVWQPYSGRSPTGRSLGRTLAFPFFADGSAHADLTAGEPVQLGPRSLFLGILVAYDDRSPFVDAADGAELSEAAADLVPVLAAPTLEVALLDGAGFLREHHGASVGRTALTTANELCPGSAMIRSDLMATCWSALEAAPEETRHSILQQIEASYRPEDLEFIEAGAVQQTVFAALAACILLHGAQSAQASLLVSAAIKAITHPWYVDRIRYLLSDPTPQLHRLF